MRLIAPVFIVTVALAATSVTPATAQPTPPLLTGPVNDFANVIDADSERELERRIRALQQASGDVLVVATVPSLDGFADINELALRMFENGGRGIGQKGKDNGVLIVLALKERQVRVEVGYDLEEFITDGFAGETIRDVLRPEFRHGQYGRGLLAGATRFINRIAERRGVELESVPRERQPNVTVPGLFPVLPFIIVWILIMLLSRRQRRRRRWGRGPWSGWNSGVGPFGGSIGGFGGGFGGFGGGGGFSGGGGFGGFGGGRSGGGGASGSW